MDKLNSIIHWAIIITDEKLTGDEKKYPIDHYAYFTRMGLNTLLGASESKDRAQQLAMALMYKYKLTGKILLMSDTQYQLGTFVGSEVQDKDIKHKVNLSHTLTIYNGVNRLILPLSQEQIDEAIIIDKKGTITPKPL